MVDAAEHGDPERAVSAAFWLMQRAYGAAPNLVTHALAAVDRLLPPPGRPGETSPMRLGAKVLAGSRDPRVLAAGTAARADAERYGSGVDLPGPR